MTTDALRLPSEFLDLIRKGAAVAVSGGSDSMALLHLLCLEGVPLKVATVNHNLRPEAEVEAQNVGTYCAAHGIAHTVLDWHWDGAGNLQDQARRARYGLLASWAENVDLSHVALGHTADDNVETFVMGLSRGAGLDGLSGMRRRFVRGKVTFHRPLLDHWRSDLRDVLGKAGVGWADDPSNDDPKYHRVRVRQALSALQQAGVPPSTIATSICHLASTRSHINRHLVDSMNDHFWVEVGELCFDLAWLEIQPPEARRRLIGAGLRFVAGRDYPPRAEKLDRVLRDLRAKTTLHGCSVEVRDRALRIGREYGAVAALRCASRLPWDGRWHFDGPHTATTEVRALGEAGLAQCSGRGASLLATPSVWDGEVLLSAPMAGDAGNWTLKAALGPEDFVASILSH